MFPITVEQIEAAYKATGIIPKAGAWLEPMWPEPDRLEHCGCPMAALVALDVGVEEAGQLAEDEDQECVASRHLGITQGQVGSFMSAFDHGRKYSDSGYDQEAFAAGLKAREKILFGSPVIAPGA